jgi:hypothetical protein
VSDQPTEAQVQGLRDALQPFAEFGAILRAMEDMGEFEKPLEPHARVAHLSFGGGSMMLTVDMFDDARKALRALETKGAVNCGE